jgi:membrane fusion protein (multidrug efflux system)
MRSIGCATACVLALAAGCSRRSGQQQATQAPPTVAVAQVTQRDVPIYGEFVGQTEAASTVEIRSQVTGFLQQIAFTEGAVVQKGQLLFVIDPRSYAAALQQARAALAQRLAALAKARQDVNRYRPLVAQHALSREQLDTAVAQEAQERANVEAARAQVAQADLNLSYTRITAPMTGRIGAALVKIGALVQTGSTLLATMYSVDPMYVTFSVSEQRHLQYQKRMREHPEEPPPLQLILADGSVYPEMGRVNMVAPQVNPATGTVTIRGEFPNPQGILKPGLFVRVRALLEQRKNATLVPQQAVQQVQGVQSVLVVGEDNKVSMHTITTSGTVDNFAVVDSGVKPGERVIVEGAQKARPGMAVTVQQAQQPTAAQQPAAQQPQGQNAQAPQPQPQQPSSTAGRAPPSTPR